MNEDSSEWLIKLAPNFSKNGSLRDGKFETGALLSVQVIFQLNADYCTNAVTTRGLHCIILSNEAWHGYYKDNVGSNYRQVSKIQEHIAMAAWHVFL